jgi:hypothetical protein
VLTNEEIRQLESELLFYTQGVGQIKKIDEFDVYVKNEHCEDSIRDLIKAIKQDHPSLSTVKLTLGSWNFL